MTRKVKVELYDGSLQSFRGFFTVEIPVPAKNECSRIVHDDRKVVIRNWGNNDYSVALFDDIDGLETNNVFRGKMTDAAIAAAEFLY